MYMLWLFKDEINLWCSLVSNPCTRRPSCKHLGIDNEGWSKMKNLMIRFLERFSLQPTWIRWFATFISKAHYSQLYPVRVYLQHERPTLQID